MKLRIKEVAYNKGMTIKELSEKTGVNPTVLSRYITNNISPHLKRLKVIADALETEVTELLPTGERYAHFYDGKSWEGIRRK